MGKAPACPCEAVLAAPSVGVGFLGCHGFLAGQAIEGFRYRFRRHCRTLGLGGRYYRFPELPCPLVPPYLQAPVMIFLPCAPIDARLPYRNLLGKVRVA